MKIDSHHTLGRARTRWHKRLVGAAVAALLIFPAGLAEEALSFRWAEADEPL